MLNDFFKLNSPFERYDANALCSHFKTSDDLRNVLYELDSWPEEKELKKVKKKTFSNVSFSKTHIINITFSECIFTDCLFIGTTFENVEFHNCEFKDSNFYKAKIKACYWDPMTIFFNKIYKEKYSNVGVDLFQKLMKNAVDTDQQTFAMNADMQFRRWKRAQLSYDQEKGKISCLEKKWLYLKSFVYEWLCGFGYRPLNFVISTILVFLLFSVLNFYLLSSAIKVNDVIVTSWGFPDSIFYTFSILTVLGFSSIIPITAGAKLLAVIEALFGIGWLGIFTSILVKRVLK